MRGSGGNPASQPRRHIAYSVGKPPPPSHYPEVQVGLEATHSVEDSYIWMASLTAAAHDPSRAPAHASGHLCELPSL